MSTDKTTAPEYPKWWDWETDGKHLAGTFLRAGRGFTVNGEKTFVVFDVAGTERTLWLHHTVLAAIFAREVRRRPDKQLATGERIEIWCLGERQGKGYVDYRAEFPDGPQVSQVDVFQMPAGQEEAVPDSSASVGGSFDDVPFQPE
jgi:hypothetical protein